MKTSKALMSLVTALAFVALLTVSCKAQKATKSSPVQTNSIFPKGELGPSENFTGNAWNTPFGCK